MAFDITRKEISMLNAQIGAFLSVAIILCAGFLDAYNIMAIALLGLGAGWLCNALLGNALGESTSAAPSLGVVKWLGNGAIALSWLSIMLNAYAFFSVIFLSF